MKSVHTMLDEAFKAGLSGDEFKYPKRGELQDESTKNLEKLAKLFKGKLEVKVESDFKGKKTKYYIKGANFTTDSGLKVTGQIRPPYGSGSGYYFYSDVPFIDGSRMDDKFVEEFRKLNEKHFGNQSHFSYSDLKKRKDGMVEGFKLFNSDIYFIDRNVKTTLKYLKEAMKVITSGKYEDNVYANRTRTVQSDKNFEKFARAVGGKATVENRDNNYANKYKITGIKLKGKWMSGKANILKKYALGDTYYLILEEVMNAGASDISEIYWDIWGVWKKATGMDYPYKENQIKTEEGREYGKYLYQVPLFDFNQLNDSDVKKVTKGVKEVIKYIESKS